MHVIAQCALREFWERHPESREPLAGWCRLMEAGDPPDVEALRQSLKPAECIAPYIVFEVGARKYRLVTLIQFNRRRVYVRHVFAPAEYHQWCDRARRREGLPCLSRLATTSAR
jgi:mRNA interferase HigB